MSIDIGTLYITQVPALTEAADIQSALRLYHYGTTSTPTDPANIIANSVAGNLRRIDTTAVFNTGTQSIGGAKTFTSALAASSTLTVTSTLTANGNTVLGSDNTDSLTVNAVSTFEGNATFNGTVSTTGNTTIGNASTDTLTINATATGLTPTAGDNSTKIATTAFVSTAIGGATAPIWFGDGSDGDVTISSGVTTLTRDMYYNNLTISGTGRLNPAGFRIFVKGSLDLSNAPAIAIGQSANNGGNGDPSGTTAAGIGATGTSSTTSYFGRSSSGGNGGIGTASNTVGTQASAVAAVSPIFFGNWIQSAGGAAPGALTVSTVSSPSSTAITWRRALVDLYAPFISGTIYCGAGGNGGNGGNGSTTFGEYGGSGGGGGAGNTGAFIYAKTIIVGTSTADSAISFVGGNGGNGGVGFTVGGGGGGGQGGFVYVVYNSISGTMTAGRSLINTSGGTGGTGYRGGQGGASGSISLINLSSGTMTVYAATAGATSGTSSGGVAAANKRTPA